MQALYEYITDLHGVVLVFQPTDMAVADLLRTLDFLKFKKVTILGLVANMAYALSPLGERFWPFLSPEVDLAQICKEFGIPLLGEIPLTPDKKVVEQAFDRIASSLTSPFLPPTPRRSPIPVKRSAWDGTASLTSVSSVGFGFGSAFGSAFGCPPLST